MLASFLKVPNTYAPESKKNTFSIIPLLYDAPFPGNSANIRINLI